MRLRDAKMLNRMGMLDRVVMQDTDQGWVIDFRPSVIQPGVDYALEIAREHRPRYWKSLGRAVEWLRREFGNHIKIDVIEKGAVKAKEFVNGP